MIFSIKDGFKGFLWIWGIALITFCAYTYLFDFEFMKGMIEYYIKAGIFCSIIVFVFFGYTIGKINNDYDIEFENKFRK